jgi:thiosulfate/3-mercaptopyruvate sulfurtransferase
MNPLVTTQWLHDHLHEPGLRIVDIRGHVLPASDPPPHYFNHYDDYQQAHIPGAVFIDWVYEITDPNDPRHARIAPPERFASVMRRAGIDAATQVVVYDDAHSMFAARLWWALLYYGHEQAMVLDGGWKKWTAEGRPVSAESPQVEPTRFIANPNPALIRTADQVQAGLHGALTLVDVRTPDEYAGRLSRTSRAGHIPGAVNLPTSKIYAADDTLLPPDQIRAQFAAVGVAADGPEVVTYCNAGVSGSLGLLAARVAGIHNVALYDGSWKDWSNDPDKPIESETPAG